MAAASLAILSPQQDRDGIRASSYASVVRFCENSEDLAQTVQVLLSRGGGRLSAIIVDLDRRRMVDIAGAIGPLYGVAATIPIAVRTSLTSATLRDLITIARYRSVHWVSIASAESADVAVRDLVRDPDGRTAQLIILDRLTRDLSPSVSGIVETATLLTHRRVSVSTLAGACGLAVRTVEWRLSSAHLPSAHTILGWMGALHSVWQLDVLGWTHKRVAREAGFGTVELCDVSIQRHTGARLLQICRAYGFDRLLDRVGVALLQRAPHSPSLILFPRLARSAPNRSCAPNRESRSQGRALCP